MKRTVLIAGSVVGLIVLLAGAAFVGARMLGGQAQSDGGSESRYVISDASGSKGFDLVAAAELPTTSPDVGGLFLRREDNSIIVGTGEVRLTIRDGQVNGFHSGPEVEIVITHDTLVYRDKTPMQSDAIVDGKLQQVVGPGSLEELETYSFISVWGEQRGDRLLARVLVYKIPLD
ncbi:MAG: hypothetical protein ACOYZ7_20575 [Chloroflexota bacterium]